MEVIQQLSATVRWWDFLAGLGLFLLGMRQIEQALRRLVGHRIRRFLRAHTSHPLQAIGSGIVTTALLQSSSLIGLLTLAMVGAQVVALSNALGVVIGANLGTTLTGWIVATIGFKLNLASLATPLIAIGAIGLVISDDKPSRSAWFRLVTALGLLLFGLEFMKSSVAADQIALTENRSGHGNPWLFLALGVVVTAVIQSSSAAMMITLAALHAGAISLLDGAAFVIGADLGTTSTVLLGTVKGSADKRRVGLAHLLFNLITDALAFFVLLPALPYLVNHWNLTEPLYVLVGFHSVFNLVGIGLFYPLLPAFSRWLERRFVKQPRRLAASLNESVLADSESALAAMDNEVAHLAQSVLSHSRQVLAPAETIGNHERNQLYYQIKTREAELIAFTLQLQRNPLSQQQSQRLQALQTGARELAHAAKSMKDCSHNLREMHESLDSTRRTLHQQIVNLIRPIHDRTQQLIRDPQSPVFETLAQLRWQTHRAHETTHHAIFGQLKTAKLDWPTVSSALNANREIYIANTDLLRGVAYLLLSAQQVEELDTLSLTANQ